MQHRKIIVSVLAILLIGIITPATTPKAHADDWYTNFNVSGYTYRGTDNYYGADVNGVPAGNTLTFTFYFESSCCYPAFQRNITMGVKFDWMTSFQNTTTPVTILTGNSAYATLSYTVPTTPGLNLVLHSYTVEAWDMAMGATWNNYQYGCPYDNGIISCHESNGNNVAIYSGPQATAVTNIQLATSEINDLSYILGSTKQAPAGTNGAIADLAGASVQLSLAQDAYNRGDFNTASTDSQNAVNQANAAQSSLATTGGGTDAATMTSIWLTGVAVIMGGIGALLLGFGGFKYLRGKTRAISGYTPTSASKP